MNLDELIKAAQNSTPEIIKEISKKVCETTGNCWHVRNGRSVFNLNYHTYYCDDCKQYQTGIINLDYTKPENFVPLVEETERIDYITRNRDHWVVSIIPRHGPILPVAHKQLGIAVCLAYLKIKENELDLPDAENVLKMRGKIKE